MKTNQAWGWLAALAAGLLFTEAHGADVALVKENHVNVRGRPSMLGEVVTQLKKDEKVVVLEELPVEKAKSGEPSRWVRIQMPANTPVWVFASYIDPTNKTVNVSRVNLRAGPGENFSVVGRLERGESVKEIRKADDWTEIETPEKAYAFMAADYLSKPEAKPAAAPTVSEKPAPAPETAKTEPDRTTLPVEPAKTETPPAPASVPAVAEKAPAPTGEPTAPPVEKLPASPTAPAETAPATANPVSANPAAAPLPAAQNVVPTLPATAPSVETVTPAPPESSGPPPKRIVRREGIVRSTKSIQAPTYFELVSLGTRKVINYLHTTDPEVKLKNFKGKKIVVTGEEGIDSNWPNTPILEVETIEIAP